MIQYCLPSNVTLLVTIDKFDPNPIFININKLKPYRFQDLSASKGLESTVESERDTTIIKTRFNTTILKNGTCTKFSFLVDGTKNQDSVIEIENQD